MKPEKYQVLIYPKAESDLSDIRDYFENVLKTTPNRLFGKILDHISFLETDPLLHPLVQDNVLKSKGYRFIPVDNFLVFYTVKETTVQIHRILFGRRQYTTLL